MVARIKISGLTWLTLILHLATVQPLHAAATAQITKLQDVSFLTLDPTLAASRAQTVCVFSSTNTKGYNVTATGSGTGSAFTLSAAGVAALPYTVQWNRTSGMTTGTALTAGSRLTGQKTTATNNTCSSGPSTTASLIVLLSAAALGTASAGVSYTGVLTLVIAPE